MSKKNIQKFIIPCLLVLIPLLFFYKTVVFQKVPFPGDLLMANYEPYKSEPGVGVVTNKGQGTDVVRELYPWKYFSIESLKSGVFPLWNPYVFSGNPHFASIQSGTLNPLNIVFFILPFITAWSVYIILQFFLALIFTYLYLRILQIQKIPSLLGSVAFAFCAFLTVWAEYGNVGHTIAFLPLTLYAIEKILQTKKIRWNLLLIFSFAFSIFAGYIQLTMYIFILDAFYVIGKFITDRRKTPYIYLSIVACFVLSVLLSAIELLPLYELVTLSLRTNYPYADLLARLMPIENSITLLVPDFFGNPATRNYFLVGGSSFERTINVGVWPFVLAIWAIFSKKSFYKTFFGIFAVITFVLTLSFPPIAYIHSVGIPFLSTGVPTRMLVIFSFCLAILGAFGLDAYLKEKNIKTLYKVLGVFSVIFAALWGSTFLLHNPVFLISRRNLIIPTGIFTIGLISLCFKAPRKVTGGIFLTLTIFELFYSFQKFNSFVPKSYVYPASEVTQKLRDIQGIYRSWGYGNGYIDTEFQIIEKNYSAEGYDPLFSKSYGELLAASENGKVPIAISRNVANIYKGYGVNDLKQNPYRQRALNLTGVKYVLNKKNDPGIDSAFDQKNYNLLWENNGWQIYENKNVLPRIKLFGAYVIVNTPKSAIKTLYDSGFDYKNKLVFLKNEFPGFTVKPDTSSNAQIISYKPNEIVIKTVSKTPQYLFISDNAFPGWKTEITNNGVVSRSPVSTTDYAFRAIPVPKGVSIVKNYYSPTSFWIGLWVSIGTFLCLILYALFATMKKRI